MTRKALLGLSLDRLNIATDEPPLLIRADATALLNPGFPVAGIRAVMGGITLRILKQGIEPLPGKGL